MAPHDKPEAQQFDDNRLAERYDGVRSTRMPDPHPALLSGQLGVGRSFGNW